MSQSKKSEKLNEAELAEVVAILRGAARYVEQGWTQGAMALAENSRPVFPAHSAACRWCITGALRRAEVLRRIDLAGASLETAAHRAARVLAYTVDARAYRAADAAATPATHWRHIDNVLANWNDAPRRTRADVLRAIADAVRRAESLGIPSAQA